MTEGDREVFILEVITSLLTYSNETTREHLCGASKHLERFRQSWTIYLISETLVCQFISRFCTG